MVQWISGETKGSDWDVMSFLFEDYGKSQYFPRNEEKYGVTNKEAWNTEAGSFLCEAKLIPISLKSLGWGSQGKTTVVVEVNSLVDRSMFPESSLKDIPNSLFISMLSGKTILLYNVFPTTTIEVLKRRIQVAEDIPPDEQRQAKISQRCMSFFDCVEEAQGPVHF